MGYTQPLFNVRKISTPTTGYSIYPDGVTTDDLYIYPNPADATPVIILYGTGYIKMTTPLGQNVRFAETTTGDYLKISYATPDAIITGMIADKNISIVPAGTGLLKYGTYVAGAKADSIGYIEILDSGGTSRRLMVQSA